MDVVKVNADIYRKIGIPQPSVSELLEMTRNDPATWDMYAKGWTLGLNQAEREKSTEKVMRYKPRNISELSAFVAGIRPAFQSMLPKLLNRERFSYGIPALDKLLQTKELPQSFILYQEQMMKVLQWAGFTAPESYAAIKAIAKKHPEKVLPMKEKFISGFSGRLVNEENTSPAKAAETTDRVWTIISDACAYGFNSCVVGDTKIRLCDNSVISVKQLYIFKDWMFKAADGGIGWYGTSYDDVRGGFVENRIVDVRYQGKREVYRVVCFDGMEIICTDNHKFPTPDSNHMVMLKDLHPYSRLYFRNRADDLYPCITKIKSITKLDGLQDVFDVEMAAPNHNFVLDNGLVVGNSHSVSVALDSLYTAWAKAHHPYETYVALMSNYSEKGDKERIARAKEEMRKAFGIRIVPCRFRQDNRGYYVDKQAGTISDALTSVKHITARVANALYAMRGNQYDSFIDLLYDMEMNPAFTSQTVDILIRMGYFAEFGSAGKLLDTCAMFREGPGRFSKSHVKATQERRLDALRQKFKELPERDIPVAEQLAFEVEHFGIPLTTYPDKKGCFAALEVDDRYSPKLRLYNIASGTVGVMKVKKPLYIRAPVKPGDVIDLLGWKRKPAYGYADGKAVPKPGVYDLWIEDYKILPA